MGPESILGRSCVFHEMPDDGGMGIEDCSKLNGCAGNKIACGVISRSM